MKVGVIVNPVAGGGRMKREWGAVRAALERRFGHLEIVQTSRHGQAPQLARGLAEAGLDILVVIGGDGTISQAVDGLLSADIGRKRRPDLAILPAGTGSDLARGLEIAGDYGSIVEAIAERPPRMLDVGRVTFQDAGGHETGRHFVNIASLGVSAGIAAAANAATNPLRLPGRLVFLAHTVRALARFRPFRARVTIDGQMVHEGEIALIAVANGRYFGGGMMIAPDAAPDDGEFDVVIVRASSRVSLLTALARVYGGTHRSLGLCGFHKGRDVFVEPLSGTLGLEADGEPPGSAPARFKLLRGALSLRW